MSTRHKKAALHLAAIVFAGASVWIHYQVKVNLAGHGTASPGRLEGVEVGSGAPDFSAVDIEGQPLKLSDSRGRSSVLLDFWATWCAPCIESMPALQEVHDEFAASGLEVIAVNLGEGLDRIERYLDRNGFTFRVVADTEQEIADQFGVSAIPSQVLIDANGIVKWVQVGYSPSEERELRQLLEQLTAKRRSEGEREDNHVRNPD